MQIVRKITYSGVVLEQEIYHLSDGIRSIGNPEKALRFKNEEERALHRDHIAEVRHARIFNETFRAGDLYSTLTFDDRNEVHTFHEARRIRDNYFRRLKYKFPEAIIHIYMGRGENTSRIHFHMVSSGIPKEYILYQWRYGSVTRVDPLREHNTYNKIDHGQDFTGLANYLIRHWDEEQGGHRWKGTRNVGRPEAEKITEIKRKYSVEHPPKAPKGYKLVEARGTQYGYLYFKYVLDIPKTRRQKIKPI